MSKASSKPRNQLQIREKIELRKSNYIVAAIKRNISQKDISKWNLRSYKSTLMVHCQSDFLTSSRYKSFQEAFGVKEQSILNENVVIKSTLSGKSLNFRNLYDCNSLKSIKIRKLLQ